MASRGLRMLEPSYNKTDGNGEKLPEFRRQNVNVSKEKGSFRFTDVSQVMDVDFFMHEHEQNIYDTLEADEPVFVDEKESDITLMSLSAQVENILDCSSMRSIYCRFNVKNEILHETEEGNKGTEEVHREVEVVKQVLDSVINSVVKAVAIIEKDPGQKKKKYVKMLRSTPYDHPAVVVINAYY